MAHARDDLETAPEVPARCAEDGEGERVLGMVVLYNSDDPGHIGSFIAAAGADTDRPGVFGRGPPHGDDDRVRLRVVRQRPGVNEPLPPFSSPSLSRDQLVVRTAGSETLELTNVGRPPLALNGQCMTTALARPGDVLEIGAQLVLLVAARPKTMRTTRPLAMHPFGEPDLYGYVGESPVVWRLRSELGFMGPLPGHVLITGATGTGKELLAMAFHSLSGRSGPMVARNAATFPESLVDAELFGNLKGYPNPGMPERPGLVGAADGGSLFLDEFAELAPEAQAKLLRVLDSGEYHSLGESRSRRSDFRLIAATNRPESALRSDLLARFDLRIRAPDLAERKEDLPFLIRHLLSKMAETNPGLKDRLFSGRGFPALLPGLVRSLARAELPANVRELRALLWRAVASSDGDPLKWPADEPEQLPATTDGNAGDRELRELERVLDANGGSIEKSWRALGLSSRHALVRLLRKHRITVTRRPMRG